MRNTLPKELKGLYERAVEAIKGLSEEVEIHIVESDLFKADKNNQRKYGLRIGDTEITNGMSKKNKNTVMKGYTFDEIKKVLGELKKQYPSCSIQLSSDIPEITADVLLKMLNNE